MKKKSRILLILIMLCFVSICLVFFKVNSASLSFNESGDSSIKVAIIDSGIDENIAKVEVKKVLNAKKNDEFGHGTIVATLINENFLKGNYSNVNLLIYDANVLDDEGKASIDDIIKGIKWAINQNVDIINISLGVQVRNDELQNVVKEAAEKNIILIGAAGNTLGMKVDYPARFSEVLSISSVDFNLQRDYIAAKGKIDYVSYGVNIDVTKVGKMQHEKEIRGTSFATANATGIIAALLANKHISKETYRTDLESYAKPLGDNDIFGKGLLGLNEISK